MADDFDAETLSRGTENKDYGPIMEKVREAKKSKADRAGIHPRISPT